ncbi:hypothetical protein K523DRAFT_14311 [Schizophyllum commune Tattone D]|nr:hypothetical protein K523DRAFT_14311 [Schizophyllum commune Tattone D]
MSRHRLEARVCSTDNGRLRQRRSTRAGPETSVGKSRAAVTCMHANWINSVLLPSSTSTSRMHVSEPIASDMFCLQRLQCAR